MKDKGSRKKKLSNTGEKKPTLGLLGVSMNPPSLTNLSTPTKSPDGQENPRPPADRLLDWDTFMKLVKGFMSMLVLF